MTNLGIAIVVLLTILALMYWAYHDGYEKGYTAGVEAKFLMVDSKWEEKKDEA